MENSNIDFNATVGVMNDNVGGKGLNKMPRSPF